MQNKSVSGVDPMRQSKSLLFWGLTFLRVVIYLTIFLIWASHVYSFLTRQQLYIAESFGHMSGYSMLYQSFWEAFNAAYGVGIALLLVYLMIERCIIEFSPEFDMKGRQIGKNISWGIGIVLGCLLIARFFVR
ncbi:MAG: hypothetical protein LUF85_09825 [Bacteroides sp.]|nr:hypothetical protein [Bacteroides sp.]